MLIFDWMLGDDSDEILKKIIVKSSIMPVAEEKYKGEVYMYTGETTDTYSHGFIYECIENEDYYARAVFDPTKIVFDENEGVLKDFFADITPDYLQVKTGRFKYLEAGDIWNINGLDENGDVVFENYQLYTQDIIDAGFLFIVPMTEISDGEEIEYELAYFETSTYEWNRIDVQPSIIAPDGEVVVETPDGSNENAVVNVEYVNNVVGTIEDVLETI